MTSLSFHRLAHGGGLVLVSTFIGWCMFSLHSELSRMSLAPVLRSWDLVIAAIGLSLANYALRCLRWREYMRRLGTSVTLPFATLSYVAGFAFTLSPGRVGEIIRARYYPGTPLHRVAAAIFVERLTDVLALLVLATLIVTAFHRYQSMIWFAAIAVAIVLATLTLLPWHQIADFIAASRRIPAFVARIGLGIIRMVIAARSLLSPGLVLLGFMVSLTAWGLEGVGLSVLAGIIGPAQLDLPLAIGIYAVAALIGALSFIPGGLGSTEAVLTALLTTQGYSIADALLVALVCRLATLWLGICLGWVAVIVLRGHAEVKTIAS